MKELLEVNVDTLSPQLIDGSCPGLSVCIRALHSAWGTAISKTPRQAKLSDFPDAIHAMYAPYMDVFRADSFMSAHIAKHVASKMTRVVPKLIQRPDAIRTALSR